MKKKILLLLIIFTLNSITSINATTFSNHLPGGKNYLEEDNFRKTASTLSSIDNIRVKSNTTYTLSFPGEGVLELPELTLETNNNTIYDGAATDYSSCDVDLSYTICTFTTDSDDTHLDLSIFAHGMDMFYDYYKMNDFQLEEGASRTTYEEYIIPFIDANSPEFNGAGAYVISYDASKPLSEIINSHIVVIDDIDGNITNRIQVISDDYSSNMNTVGEYTVELKASDLALNTAYFTLTVIVKDEISPTISGPTTISVPFDTTHSLAEILSDNYTALDSHDGSVALLVESDEYTSNKATVGSYEVLLEAYDQSNNSTGKTITILVVDQNAPTLSTNTSITIYQSEPKTLQDVVNSIIFTDDYDASEDIIKTIISESYTNLGGSPGTSSLIIQGKDSSNNSIVETITILIVDDIVPVIEGPNSFVFSYTDLKTIDEMINTQTVSDNETGLSLDDIFIVSETYTTRLSKVGTYVINLEVTDDAGNKTQKQLHVEVIDDQVPIIYVDNIMITLSDNVTFTPQDALNLLIKNNELPNKPYNVAIIKDEYSGNEETPGQYQYSLRFDDEEGNSLQKDFIIEVPDEPSLFEDEQLIRNVSVYSISFIILVLAIIKRKK